jgi:predicted amidohydrolase
MPETTLAAANLRIATDKQRNMARFIEAIGEAADKGARVLVLPEAGLQGYIDFGYARAAKETVEQKQYFYRESETIPGPATDRIAAEARRHNMFIQIGLAERALNGNAIFNSTALVGPEGVVSVFRKIHNHFEWPYFLPGEDTPIADLPFGKSGSIICYDLCFPEIVRSYALRGADMILMSNAWPMRGHDRDTDYHGYAMDLAAKANAFFNQCWLVISNHCETGTGVDRFDYYGGSQIVDPRGVVVAYAAQDEAVLTHTADLQAVLREARTDSFFCMNLLQDRRPEHYGPLVDQSYRRVPIK